MSGMIIAGFPGVGKSHFKGETHLKASDSDSSQFSWVINEAGEKVRNPDFPKSYLDHIEEAVKTHDVVFVSTHPQVLKGLVERKLFHTIVYPDRTLKETYLCRYALRGSPSEFVSLMDSKWDEFITDIEEAIGDSHREYIGYIRLLVPNAFIDDGVISSARYQHENW